MLLAPLVLLLAAACLPLGRVFIGWGFLRPVLAAVLITVGLSWGCRRFGAGPVLALGVSVLGWAAFVGAAFLRDTTILGLVPTPASIEAFRDLWSHGLQVIGTRPAPTFAEPSLMLLTVTGVWALTHAVDGMVFRLEAPVKAIVPALGLWLVPVLLTLGDASPAVWTVPFLGAAAVLVLVANGTEVGRWGRQVRAPGRHRTAGPLGHLVAPGVLIAGVAITLGVLVASTLPGFGEPPWYEFRGVGGTTLTTNPIVTIRHSLVATDQGPVLQVTTERPVYLRTTALDVYSENGEWTNVGIRGTAVSGSDGQVRPESPLARSRPLDVAVEVVNLPGAVLVPAPYQPRAVSGEVASNFQFDQRLATLTTDRGATLQPGDRYTVAAAIPDPHPEALRTLQAPPRTEHVELPGNVPDEVVDLARQIVDEAGAQTPFEQALALQDEFQSDGWEYSLDPPQGHSGDAMLAFINERVGYCEQYAGTMAVMLRSLGVPARVAVGFTPGEQVAEGVYEVTNGNAHAWVEVLFPGHGWLAFEPTPRQDGNVLPPSADNLAPEMTLRQQAAAEPVEVPETTPDDPALPETEPPPASDDGPEDTTGGSAGAADDEGGAGGLLLAVLLALVGVAGLAAVGLRRRGGAARTPLTRVLDARERVGTVGRGLGMGAGPWETDHEYLERIAGAASADGSPAALTLAGRVAEARYAPAVPAAAAEEAEAAADALRRLLLAGRSAPGRALVLLRGTAATTVGRLADALRGTVGRLRRR